MDAIAAIGILCPKAPPNPNPDLIACPVKGLMSDRQASFRERCVNTYNILVGSGRGLMQSALTPNFFRHKFSHILLQAARDRQSRQVQDARLSVAASQNDNMVGTIQLGTSGVSGEGMLFDENISFRRLGSWISRERRRSGNGFGLYGTIASLFVGWSTCIIEWPSLALSFFGRTVDAVDIFFGVWIGLVGCTNK